jgi:hypothetical protein
MSSLFEGKAWESTITKENVGMDLVKFNSSRVVIWLGETGQTTGRFILWDVKADFGAILSGENVKINEISKGEHGLYHLKRRPLKVQMLRKY